MLQILASAQHYYNHTVEQIRWILYQQIFAYLHKPNYDSLLLWENAQLEYTHLQNMNFWYLDQNIQQFFLRITNQLNFFLHKNRIQTIEFTDFV